MTAFDILFPAPTGGRNADDMGMPPPQRSGFGYTCGWCNYSGPCYGAPVGDNVGAPWCPRCGRNDKLTEPQGKA